MSKTHIHYTADLKCPLSTPQINVCLKEKPSNSLKVLVKLDVHYLALKHNKQKITKLYFNNRTLLCEFAVLRS